MIEMTPKYRDIPVGERPRGFYVYLHRRATDGSVFYVGKGRGDRAWHISRNYNRRWMGTAKRYGVAVDVVKSGMDEVDAFDLEIETILHYGLENLVNMTLGGDGSSGAISGKRLPVCCSNGMTFDSMNVAAEWLRSVGHERATAGAISGCCSGSQKSSYGFTWWLADGGVPVEFVDPYERKAEVTGDHIIRSDGMEFISATRAAKYMRSTGSPKADQTAISACVKGNIKSAYGFGWAYASLGAVPEYKPSGRRISDAKSKSVVRPDGVEFASAKIAAEEMGFPSSRSNIGMCCAGKRKYALGYSWSFKEKGPY